jgi:hypothetical protein
MNKHLSLWLCSLGLCVASASAQLQLDSQPYLYSTNYDRGVNYRSGRGVPLSNTTNNPAGSDGRAPAGGTPNQFMGQVAFGAVTRPATPSGLIVNSSITNLAQNAVSLNLPRGSSGGSVVLVLRGNAGAPYFSRQTSFAFGAVITPPLTDEGGALLSAAVQSTYWAPEPLSANNHSNAPYYWSPHAGRVFAIQPGPVQITWRKAVGTGTAPPGPSTNIGGIYYPLTNALYIVAGSASKTPRKMYWTERTFLSTGTPVIVPTAQVRALRFVYSSEFPETVNAEFVAPGESLIATNALKETRTIWYDADRHQILAYNREGRVFLELLGDSVDGDTRRHLGYEIVDVVKEVAPLTVPVELGEELTPYPGRPDPTLKPERVKAVDLTKNFVYQHTANGRIRFYATRETQNTNDMLLHWLEDGVEGLQWPFVFARYQQGWPSDAARYSHYVRPLVATEAEAQQTAVPLPTDNVPLIEHQDDLKHPRGKLTAEFRFYSFLEPAYPVHRTLLRFTSGDRVRFERVLSVLNTTLSAQVPADGSAQDRVILPPEPWLTGSTLIKPGSALRLNGPAASGNTYGQMPAGDYFGESAFTIETWILVREHRAWARVMDFGNGQAANNVLLAASLEGSQLPGLQFFDGGGTLKLDLTSDTQLLQNQWVHLVATYESGTARLYQDGVLTASKTGVPAPASVTRTNCFIGRSNWGDSDAKADFANFRIWSAARTPSQIMQDRTSVYPSGTPGLTAQFLFNGTGSPALDNSGNGKNMTLFGSFVLGAGSDHPFPPSGLVTALTNLTAAPRFVRQTVYVGDRLAAPAGELGGDGDAYYAGYLNQSQGKLFHPGAYRDPFATDFDSKQSGAIIPVNAVPGTNQLEVLWFRKNQASAAQGFKPVYWPSILGRYLIAWPTSPSEIVLASNDGSGPLDSLQARGTIYTQNNPALPGYNPNEEHAVLIGGQAYALRDDLNLTGATVPAQLSGAGATYSSDRFVLLDYTAADGRPAIRAFRVLRENPADGIVFDYPVAAGTLLQAPMPLPFLPPPVEIVSKTKTNYNTEPAANSGDLPTGWQASMATSAYSNYASFTYRDRKQNYWVMRGVHAGQPTLQAGRFETNTSSWTTNLPAATAIVGQPFTNVFHTSRRTDSLVLRLDTNSPALPTGLSINGLTLAGTPTTVTSSILYQFTITDVGDNTSVTNTLALTVNGSGSVVSQGPLTVQSTNRYALNTATYVGRPPFLAAPATNANSFTMRFYYKTQPGFAWPGVGNAPAEGSIVPYLRPLNAGGSYEGAPGAKNTAALDIVYRPYWPGNPPKMAFGETLTDPKNGLPAIRGQTSAQVLYQQSIGQNITNARASVVLHDPTREKTFALSTGGLSRVPDGVRKDSYQGRVYFPNLPPHLAQRFYFDPNRGQLGSLVLRGEFKDEVIGEKYLLLNVLGAQDLATVKALCPSLDANKARWDGAVDGLATAVETFRENLNAPGTYRVETSTSVGVTNLAEITDDDMAVDSYALSAAGPGSGYVTVLVGGGEAFTPKGEPVSAYVMRVTGSLYRGSLKVLPSANPLNEQVSLQHTADLAGKFSDYEYEWRINPPVDGQPPTSDATMSRYQVLTNGVAVPRYTLGGSGIQALVDNWIVLRYRPKNTSHPLYNQWSEWTEPQLAEGWIKRVLAGINPFNQRVTDLYNNTVNTDANILTSAGKRWEGDIALNLENINNYGLIEIYETVLRRGKALSIEAGINFGPANDALLLAAGYLNDLYMLVGTEALADAANPTIGIGTKDKTYGDIATALFAFKGQMPSLLEEELALLRGRDDVLQPGVTTAPVYNRLFWNYTRGIDAGEVIYALNYNILDQNTDGKADATDAAKLYPQGHGDAYGHYLTAAKGYYALLMNTKFDWVPRVETVTVLGKPVTVDYFDERKFASAGAALARAGRQIFDLTWRKDYVPGRDLGWDRFSTNRVSTRDMVEGRKTSKIVRHWGADQWASRAGQGAFLNWVIGNALLPSVDPDSTHEGIQKIDRTTVPELTEIATTAEELQTGMDNAEGRLTPLGLAEGSLAFDINPNIVVGANPQPHFEQIYDRAKRALNNALAAFDDAKDVTRLMRSEQDSLADFRAGVDRQELAYTNALIELYGTPYPDDVGPGETYKQDYAGPDLVHFAYVEPLPKMGRSSLSNPKREFQIDIQNFTLKYDSATADDDGKNNGRVEFDFVRKAVRGDPTAYRQNLDYISFTLDASGVVVKPDGWTGRRASPGKLQDAISRVQLAENAARGSLSSHEALKRKLDNSISYFNAVRASDAALHKWDKEVAITHTTLAAVAFTAEMSYLAYKTFFDGIKNARDTALTLIPKSTIVGVAAGGDMFSAAQAAVYANYAIMEEANGVLNFVKQFVQGSSRVAKEGYLRLKDATDVQPLIRNINHQKAVLELDATLVELQETHFTMNQRLQELNDAMRAYQSLVGQGNRIQQEREIFREDAAAVIQGYRTRDAAFRLFRNEKLERYKALFDLAARYSYLAANAYDYETGLLNTPKGKAFVNRIVNSRALGVVREGEPQFAGSNTGDPGLSSALAEMKADWDVLKGRLGFNNPDAYGTTVSLRTEALRILPGAEGNGTWQDMLQAARKVNILDDADVRRYCLQVDPGNGLPVPGIVLEFSTTIANGYNLFGQPLAAGDSDFSPSRFATKLYGAGVAFIGYRGMSDPAANSGAVSGSGSTSPSDPSQWYLDPKALAATPDIYLIPVGVDSMRSPPLGDASAVRSWTVDDVTIPLPFNIGGTDFSTKQLYQSSESLTEALFGIRKHQSFRPVSTTAAFAGNIYGSSGSLQPSQYTNRRLIGRSVWNSKWKLIIPGNELFNNPNEGLDRFIQTVTDVKLHLVTYSYSGN